MDEVDSYPSTEADYQGTPEHDGSFGRNSTQVCSSVADTLAGSSTTSQGVSTELGSIESDNGVSESEYPETSGRQTKLILPRVSNSPRVGNSEPTRSQTAADKEKACEYTNWKAPSSSQSHSRLAQHPDSASSSRPFVCPFADACGLSFASEDNLRAHLDTQHPECPMCSACLSSLEELSEHMAEHPECQECGIAFKSKLEHQEHMASVHAGKGAGQCPFCGKAGLEDAALEQHVATAHACNIDGCDWMGEDLAAHTEQCHPSTLKCDSCGAKLPTYSSWLSHIESCLGGGRPPEEGPLKECPICKLSFRKMSQTEIGEHECNYSPRKLRHTRATAPRFSPARSPTRVRRGRKRRPDVSPESLPSRDKMSSPILRSAGAELGASGDETCAGPMGRTPRGHEGPPSAERRPEPPPGSWDTPPTEPEAILSHGDTPPTEPEAGPSVARSPSPTISATSCSATSPSLDPEPRGPSSQSTLPVEDTAEDAGCSSGRPTAPRFRYPAKRTLPAAGTGPSRRAQHEMSQRRAAHVATALMTVDEIDSGHRGSAALSRVRSAPDHPPFGNVLLSVAMSADAEKRRLEIIGRLNWNHICSKRAQDTEEAAPISVLFPKHPKHVKMRTAAGKPTCACGGAHLHAMCKCVASLRRMLEAALGQPLEEFPGVQISRLRILKAQGTCRIAEVDRSDPREALRGKRRLVASKDLWPGDVVHVYQGRLMTEKEYQDMRSRPPPEYNLVRSVGRCCRCGFLGGRLKQRSPSG